MNTTHAPRVDAPVRETASAPAPRGHVPALEVRDLHKCYGTTRAVDGISLRIEPGEIVALLGRNGAGKTTLIDLALGLQRPDRGEARLLGMPPREAIRRSLVGVVHQSGALLDDTRVADLLRLIASLHGTAALDVEEVMARTDLTDLARQKVRTLSGGERQRVRLALALLPDPRLLILDEPTTGMDVEARRHFWEVMRAQADEGRTIVLATHYLAEAQDFSARTVIVEGGRVRIDAPTDEVRRMASHMTLTARVGDEVPEAVRSDLLTRLHSLVTRAQNGAAGADAGTGSDAPTSCQPRFGAARTGDVVSAQIADGVLTVTGSDLDEAARAVLATPGLHGIEITAASLEDAFSALVGPEQEA